MKMLNKTCIVTGAGQGIGKTTALLFAQEGAKVIVNDIVWERAVSVCNEINANKGVAKPVQADIAIRHEVEKLVRETLNNFGQIDILINNAAVQTISPFLELKEEEWRRVIDVNLTGYFLCSQLVAREMIKNPAQIKGKIINLSSIHQTLPRFNKIHYDVSKAGVMMLTKEMALELAEYHINVNGIAPGAIATPMNQDILISSERIRELSLRIPLKRIGLPEEVAKAVLFLASDDADYITGEILTVDGGKNLLNK